MYDVVTVGSSTLDVFADTASELIKIKTERGEEELIAYPAGAKILIKRLIFSSGGGGTNAAVSLARLGHKTAYLGKIGNDDTAGVILKELKKEGVDFIGTRGDRGSGYSIILDSLEHDRTILTYKGSNNDLGFKEINFEKLKTGWFYFSSMMEESFNTLERLAEFAAGNGIKLLFNPSSYLAEKGLQHIRKIVENCEILVLNKEEAEMVIGKDSVEKMMKELQLFSKIIVVTDGRNGAHAYDGKVFYRVKANNIKVVESTGAGDAFASGFLSGIMRKKDIRLSLMIAAANAESILTHKGAKKGLLTWKEACSRIKKNPPIIEVKKR